MKRINTNKTLTKKQIKAFARIHSAIHLSYVDVFLFDEDMNVSEKECKAVIREINAISQRLIKEDPTTLGDSGAILDYVKRNY